MDISRIDTIAKMLGERPVMQTVHERGAFPPGLLTIGRIRKVRTSVLT
ncbi:hypothetical protein ABZW96_36185 [Nocardia sp. NPDC004168]